MYQNILLIPYVDIEGLVCDMLNRDAKTYKLQRLSVTEDEYGYIVEQWETLQVVDVTINEQYKQTTDAEGVVYMRRVLQGVTRYSQFELGAKYRIVGDAIFEVLDFIGGRLTQLQLKEVV